MPESDPKSDPADWNKIIGDIQSGEAEQLAVPEAAEMGHEIVSTPLDRIRAKAITTEEGIVDSLDGEQTDERAK